MRISRLQACLLATSSVAFLCAQAPVLAQEDPARLRVFEEPLVPLGPPPAPGENAALIQALSAYQAAPSGQAAAPLQRFLDVHPASPWRASLLANLGLVYRRSGYYSRALEAWEKAWALLKDEKDPKAAPLGDRTVAELAEILARLGRTQRLQALLKDVQGRPVRGSASEKLVGAQESLHQMTQEPERNFRCGPVSLASIRQAQGRPEPRLHDENCTADGTSLAHNAALARKYGMAFQMARREKGAPVIVPAMVHWRTHHFAAVVKEANGRYLLQDPIFPDDIWVTREALDDEGSGYALVPAGPLPKGWKPVSDMEAQTVWGKGGAPWGDNRNTGRRNNREGSCDSAHGMAVHGFHSLVASLNLTDIPVGYVPAKGPAVMFEVNYIQREERQPQTLPFANLGPKWAFDFFGYIEDDPRIAIDSPSISMRVWSYERGGGMLPFDFDGARGADVATSTPTGPTQPQHSDHSRLVRLNLNAYLRLFPDGSRAYYEKADGSSVFPRRVFLTKVVDAAGNALTFNYDGQLRLTSAVDALGQVTAVAYEHADPLKVTRVTDPFGRSATFQYNAAGQLARITDVVGLTSEFAYGPTPESPDLPQDFVNALTTPYGTHRYDTGQDSDGKWVEAKDPLGNRERMEFKRHPVVEAHGGPYPAGFEGIRPGGSFYWNKRAMALHPGDYNQAKYTRWATDGSGSLDVPFAIKPMGSPVFTTFFTYPGAPSPYYGGTLERPSRVIRAQGDGTFAETRFEYNAAGRVTKSTDPLGRETTFVYEENLLDLKEVRQTGGGRHDLLAAYAYDTAHRPLTVKDAAGQTTTLAWNAAGQLDSVRNPLGQTVTLGYNALHQLTAITAPGHRVTSLTYDAVGRVASVTSPEGQTLATEYDALDRPTKVTYPDLTTEELRYDRLDVALRKDRSGKLTTLTHNALRQLVEVQDSLGRSTRFDWCGCGVLEGLVDPMNKVTTWLHDLRGHVTGKLYPDGGRLAYAYDLQGRLIQRVDAKGQITRYAYHADDSLKAVTYANTARPEPSVAYQYEADYRRLASVARNGQEMRYAYHPVEAAPKSGAGRLASVTGPLPTDVLAYAYDELGRVTTRTVKGRASTLAFDALGRVTQTVNPLGTFAYGYDGSTGRLLSVTHSGGLGTTFDYYGADQEHRLKTIHHRNAAGATLSRFGYTYDLEGQIKTWTQVAGPGDPRTYEFGYDAVGQLLGATLTGLNGQVLRRFAYGYDPSGNRTSETVDGRTTTGIYNEANQLLHLRSSGNDAPIAPGGASASRRKAPRPSAPKAGPRKPSRATK